MTLFLNSGQQSLLLLA